MGHLITVGSKGRLTLPVEIRKDFRISPGTFLAVLSCKEEIILKPLDRPSRFGGVLDNAIVTGQFVRAVRREWDR
ncbi:MAG: AbrB/MazE/SpoVT family DNA-binding domain-containing protein [Candidatus Aenigmarchaeota archaeon]|nr:AbrB/MazE/SpoVT family DNA-binding domain-containing protein [Candidatus Aenigmarchaeota archaeon]